jgi:hypothetical protein
MNKTQAKRYQVYLAIKRFIEQNAQHEALVQLPVYVQLSQQFITTLQTLQSQITTEDLIVPSATIKKNQRVTLEDISLRLSKALCLKGKLEKNLGLENTFDILKKDLYNLTASQFLNATKELYTKALPYQSELANFGIQVQDFEAWQTALQDYEAHINDPAYQRSELKSHNQLLRGYFAELEDLNRNLTTCIEIADHEELLKIYKATKLV